MEIDNMVYIHPTQIEIDLKEGKEMSVRAVEFLFNCAVSAVKIKCPNMQETDYAISTDVDHIQGTITNDGKDKMLIPAILTALDGRRERVLLYEAIVDALLTWNDDPQDPKQFIERHMLYNSDKIFMDYMANEELSAEDRRWHDMMRVEDETAKKINIGKGNVIMQMARIVQEKLHLKIPAGWRFILDYDCVNSVDHVKARVQYSSSMEYALISILGFAIDAGISTDVWANYPVADMNRRMRIRSRCYASDFVMNEIDFAKYIDDGAYKASILITIEAKVTRFIEANEWFKDEPTEDNETNGPCLKAPALAGMATEAPKPQEQNNDTTPIYN